MVRSQREIVLKNGAKLFESEPGILSSSNSSSPPPRDSLRAPPAGFRRWIQRRHPPATSTCAVATTVCVPRRIIPRIIRCSGKLSCLCQPRARAVANTTTLSPTDGVYKHHSPPCAQNAPSLQLYWSRGPMMLERGQGRGKQKMLGHTDLGRAAAARTPVHPAKSVSGVGHILSWACPCIFCHSLPRARVQKMLSSQKCPRAGASSLGPPARPPSQKRHLSINS